MLKLRRCETIIEQNFFYIAYVIFVILKEWRRFSNKKRLLISTSIRFIIVYYQNFENYPRTFVNKMNTIRNTINIFFKILHF